MEHNRSKLKNNRRTAISHFFNDLLRALAKESGVNQLMIGGHKVELPSAPLSFEVSFTGFSGITLQVRQATSKRRANLSFIVQGLEAPDRSKIASKPFPFLTHGYGGAFNKAIQERARLVGYQGEIPYIDPPSPQILRDELSTRYGNSWITDNSSVLREAIKG